MKNAVIGAGLLLLCTACIFLLLKPSAPERPDPSSTAPSTPKRAGTDNTASSQKQVPPASSKRPEVQHLNMALDLNAPSRTIRDDLITLDGVFQAYQSNFLKEGNPVGLNHEITAALAGQNSLHLAFISSKHKAINARGELCDRWGTPFFFHQLSAGRMQIISAGPDRERGTADDVKIE